MLTLESAIDGLSICNRYTGRRTGTNVNMVELLARTPMRRENTTDFGSDDGVDGKVEVGTHLEIR